MTEYDDYIIREATAEDAGALREIYAYYVEETAVSFEYRTPSVEEFTQRIADVRRQYPYLLVECDGNILGFAFAHAFRERPAYDYAAEVTIYLRRDMRHKGLGRRIYTALEEELRRMGVQGIYACVALPRGQDSRLSMDSPLFHKTLGYRRCGTFTNCGRKFGVWYTMIWMEKMIGEYPEPPAPLTAYPELLMHTEKKVPEPLSKYDDCQVRLVTEHGEMFCGEACSFSAEFGMHELGVEEEGIQIGSYMFFLSDIRSVERIG